MVAGFSGFAQESGGVGVPGPPIGQTGEFVDRLVLAWWISWSGHHAAPFLFGNTDGCVREAWSLSRV